MLPRYRRDTAEMPPRCRVGAVGAAAARAAMTHAHARGVGVGAGWCGGRSGVGYARGGTATYGHVGRGVEWQCVFMHVRGVIMLCMRCL